MAHRFPLKEIARQSGLSTATIDRVINNRPNVSPQTKARVAAALLELEGQEAQMSARGRRMFFDFLIEAPARFSREVKHAAEYVAPRVGAAVCRTRFEMHDVMSEAQAIAALKRIAKRGSDGVCIKLRDLPAVRDAVENLIATGIPVVTLVTDLTDSRRISYVGLDNQSAGRTAAYLVAKTCQDRAGTVLTSRSSDQFQGEEERELAFVQSLRAACPQLRIVDASGGSGIHSNTARLVQKSIQGLRDLRAVYSMGGGNHSILKVLGQNGLKPDIYVAHDLDHDNRALIQSGQLSYVLHHDLRVDLENVFRALLHYHKLTATAPTSTISNVHVVTPENVPF